MSQIAFFMNPEKNGSRSSITYPISLRIMQAALSSVNCGLKVKPSAAKNCLALSRSRTARFTKTMRGDGAHVRLQ
ncbi:MAG: hypothetical protein U0164_18925 [Gemmatimonadaceae bacterium]